jgi:hypothetical protein
MRAKELVPILAEIFGVPFDTAFVIDRALAEKGFRAKGKGRAWPQMTRREAIHFLIACMCMNKKATAATRAAEDVALWVSAESELSVVYNKTSAEELAGYDAMARRHDAKARRRLLTEKVDRSLRLPFLKGLHGQTVALVDYLLMVTSHMEDGNDITLTLSPSHFEAIVKIRLRFGQYDQQNFFVKHSLAPVVDPDRIRTDISVYGTFLAAIAARTDDPFAEGLNQHPRKRGAT